jgi:hypothetical protein
MKTCSITFNEIDEIIKRIDFSELNEFISFILTEEVKDPLVLVASLRYTFPLRNYIKDYEKLLIHTKNKLDENGLNSKIILTGLLCKCY